MNLKEKKDFLLMSEQEFDTFMCQTFPLILKKRNLPISESCIGFGFEINKGWYYILYEICLQLQKIYESTSILCVFEQVKEKFASLRIYYSLENIKNNKDFFIWREIIDSVIYKGCEKSRYTDEITGEYILKPIVSESGWIYAMSKKTFKKLYPNVKIKE